MRVLDVGCGVGFTTLGMRLVCELLKKRSEVWGVDILEYERDKVAGLAGLVKFETSDLIEFLQRKREKFDFINVSFSLKEDEVKRIARQALKEKAEMLVPQEKEDFPGE